MEQVALDANGSYSFEFLTLETLSAKTGDFTVMLSVEGGSAPMHVQTLEAPKPEYTVNFVGQNDQLISSVTVRTE